MNRTNRMADFPRTSGNWEFNTLEAQVQCLLHGRIRHLRLQVCDTGLILRGSAPTYYVKQLAQHAVMKATNYPIAANDIEVF
jgi:hypothetical protein